MVNMDCATVQELAARFQPILRFHHGERLFPILAESWIGHCSTEPWASPNAKLRGTAIMRASTGTPGVPADTSFAAEEFVTASCANTGFNSLPIRNQRGNDPAHIGNPAYAVPPDGEDVFLNFGGWDDPVSFSKSSPAYLAEVFSNLSHAVNPQTPETPLDKLTSTTYVPRIAPPQPLQPTVYAEVEWAGIYPRIDYRRPGEQKDFPPEAPYQGLDEYVVINYYLLYAAAEPPPAGDDGVRRLEGQWEAISVFLKGDPGAPSQGSRPGSFAALEPRFVVYSQGFERTDGPNPPAECRPWEDPAFPVQKDGDHVIAFPSAGTHRNLFDRRTGAIRPPEERVGTHVVAVNVGTPGYNDEAGRVGMGLWAAGIAAMLFPATFLLGIALLVAGLIAMIVGLFLPDDEDPVPEDVPREDPVPPGEEAVATSETGPAAVPQGGAPSGSPPKASTSVEWSLRTVDRFHLDINGDYPPDGSDCEHPPWWDFAGRWGVKLVEPVGPKADSGSRRTDRYERSRGYWNARELVRFTSANPSQRL